MNSLFSAPRPTLEAGKREDSSREGNPQTKDTVGLVLTHSAPLTDCLSGSEVITLLMHIVSL